MTVQMQNQVNDIALFGLSVILLGLFTRMMRSMVFAALGGEKSSALLPSTTPQAQLRDIDILDRLIKEKLRDINWEKWPHGSISDARKAVYKDILEGFSTVQEAKEYIEDMPEDAVIFTARGDEIPFSLIRIIIADIERNPWLSPFRAERQPNTNWQPPLLPHSIPRDELKRIAERYGWWAAKLAEAVCPHNDVACVEREARRLAQARTARRV
jgi:hypothetical protein